MTNAEQKSIQTNVVVGKQDPLQLLPDFQLTLSFLVPPTFSAEDFTKSDEHLLTKRIQLHLQDVIQAETNNNKSNATAYIYMKSTNRNLQRNSHNLTTISRQFSGFIRAAVDVSDVNNIANDAFQTNTNFGVRKTVVIRNQIPYPCQQPLSMSLYEECRISSTHSTLRSVEIGFG